MIFSLFSPSSQHLSFCTLTLKATTTTGAEQQEKQIEHIETDEDGVVSLDDEVEGVGGVEIEGNGVDEHDTDISGPNDGSKTQV